MRKTILLYALMACMYSSAQESLNDRYMYIYYNDQTVERIQVSKIDSIKFTAPETGKYEAIDLGLSVKWASYNVGATAPEKYGGYYAWGETEEKSEYTWENYKWCNGSYDTLTKYCTGSSYGVVDNKTELDPEDDVAHVKWGAPWRMPTTAEQQELIEKCRWEWTKLNGVKGRKVTGPNGNSIFLPAAGYRDGVEVYNKSYYSYYWQGTLDSSYPFNTHYMYFCSEVKNIRNGYRNYGMQVRPVCE